MDRKRSSAKSKYCSLSSMTSLFHVWTCSDMRRPASGCCMPQCLRPAYQRRLVREMHLRLARICREQGLSLRSSRQHRSGSWLRSAVIDFWVSYLITAEITAIRPGSRWMLRDASGQQKTRKALRHAGLVDVAGLLWTSVWRPDRNRINDLFY